MLAGMLAGCAILIVVSVGLLAVYQGMQERTRLNRSAAIEHYHRGLEQFAAENYELAQAEFELAIQLDPSNRDAETKLVEVNLLLSRQPTPTSAVRRQTALLLYNEARDLYNKGDWEGVISKLEQVQVLDAEFEREQVTALLLEAYYKAGQRLVSETRMEEAIRYFDRALVLRPGDLSIRDEKRYAALYLAGIGYWGANWQGVIDTFNALYQLRPDYKDTQQRLFDAHVEYGDYFVSKNQWCNARDQYEGALSFHANDEVKAKRDDAQTQCAQASLPTPTPAPTGTFVGRLVNVEDVGAQTAMMIRGQVLDGQSNPMVNVRVGLSAFDWNAPPALTNGEGVFAFDGLANPVTYTVTLLDLPTVPLPVKADWSKLAWVEFQPQE
jgi:tetratricopeptide (TPR) repeat protein